MFPLRIMYLFRRRLINLSYRHEMSHYLKEIRRKSYLW